MTTSGSTALVADVLVDNLTRVFSSLCDERYGGDIQLRRGMAPAESESPSSVYFRLKRPDLPPLRVHFRIHHVGGNVFDLQGTVEGGPSGTFTYCLPDDSTQRVPVAPSLARNVSTFLLDALERRLGGDLLREGSRHQWRTVLPDRMDSPSRTGASSAA